MGLFAFLKSKFSKKERPSSSEKSSEEVYAKGMEKSRKNFASRLDQLSKRYAKIDSEYFEELEEILIESDVGVDLSIRLCEALLDQASREKITEPKAINEMLVDQMFVGYATKGDAIQNEIEFAKDGPTVLLVCGVNGVGKTTSIAKLAYRYLHQGKKVMLVAGDTFRAGAVEQLSVWAERLHCPIITGKPGSDPASVAYDGAKAAVAEGVDLLIVDTAGRLQTKANLMQELSKIRRVLEREIPGAPHETFLIIDATTGQNGVLQAKAFKEVTNISGIVITKMDGTSKGGIILSIRDELGVPVRFIGLGEGMGDLQEFDLDKYLYGLLLGGEENGVS
ncbi:MAG: signal recognition particle-docking protein FtsY [Candidatus Enteromonas sp.]|nr:signal recognition particle-docking protein FtsY [Candidatus Enteromonas sp.]